ncbi:MAG: hypothetical protein JRF45_10395 [Deltaproteobacteria bacterium]|nr:hypothetical protein [Deltaproteobacteria bacterium]MBW1826387.1 hypothetical protein [Deltaproteobacteria bacterium]MBW1968881.1 hypothetical protein [Deltaproteobacteria bacterium]MBW2156089.1 hypothetical protein [Deltaproteobacteria bacterium]MBW2197632.1 hypothetical protein [Deltaproteobacteria bacterium]
MIQLSRSVGIILVLIVGFLVQVLFSLADQRDTPNKAVVEFSKAYFQLDRSMADRICQKQLTTDDVDIVDQHLYLAAKEANERGFDINFIKNKLYHIETETLSKNDTTAKIRITGKTRVAINHVYPIVAQLFNIGATHEVNQTFNVIKEDNQWKVCGNLFSLP